MQSVISKLKRALASVITPDSNEHAVVSRAVRLLETVNVDLDAPPVPTMPDAGQEEVRAPLQFDATLPDTIKDETR